MVLLQDGRGRPPAQGLRHDVCCFRECRHYPVSSAAGDRNAFRVELEWGDSKLWYLIVDNLLARVFKDRCLSYVSPPPLSPRPRGKPDAGPGEGARGRAKREDTA